MENERLVVLSGGLAGREAEYLSWYRDEHLDDMLSIEPVLAGQLCSCDPPGGTGRRHVAAIYDIAAGSADAVFAEIGRRRGTPAFRSTDALDRSVTVFSIVTALEPREHSSDETSATHRLISFAAEPHALRRTDAASLSGQWQRYSVRPAPLPPASPWRSLSYAAVSPDDPADLLARARAEASATDPAGEADFLGLFRLVARRSKA